MNGQQRDVLLAEGSVADVMLLEEAFKATVKQLRLSQVEDGVEGLALLRREGHFAPAPRPKLLRPDLNLPLMDRCEVLAALGANAYLTKTRDLPGSLELVRLIDQFWPIAVCLPRGGLP